MANPQLEDGHTRIANEILEHIISSNLNGTEMAIILLIIRKTYGFQKLEDEISLSQFCDYIPVSKETICTALHNLQLVKIIRLVKKGSSKICSNLWVFNKDFDSWQLVKKTKLVKISRPTSQVSPPPTSQENLTYKRNIQKKIQKKGLLSSLFSDNKIPCNTEIYQYLKGSKQRHIYILGLFAEWDKLTRENEGQWNVWISGNIQAASKLVSFSDSQLLEAFDVVSSRKDKKTGEYLPYSLRAVYNYFTNSN